jgi:hypothetical protein
MAFKRKKVDTPKPSTTDAKTDRIQLGELLSEKAPSQDFIFWIVGDTPIIVHAWSEKAKGDMLKTQAGATRTAKEKRDPEKDFLQSLYDMGDGIYGFPVTAVKKAILSCAHKDRGVPRSDVMQALWLDAEVVRVRPALAGAICDMPLVRIYGSQPEMREDMVRIGAGLRKTANLAYRAQFTTWALRITGNVNPLMVAPHALAFLVRQAGSAIGIGDWRNEKGGWFGAFHIATPAEQREWEAHARGGPVPKTPPRRPVPILEAAE